MAPLARPRRRSRTSLRPAFSTRAGRFGASVRFDDDHLPNTEETGLRSRPCPAVSSSRGPAFPAPSRRRPSARTCAAAPSVDGQQHGTVTTLTRGASRGIYAKALVSTATGGIVLGYDRSVGRSNRRSTTRRPSRCRNTETSTWVPPTRDRILPTIGRKRRTCRAPPVTTLLEGGSGNDLLGGGTGDDVLRVALATTLRCRQQPRRDRRGAREEQWVRLQHCGFPLPQELDLRRLLLQRRRR